MPRITDPLNAFVLVCLTLLLALVAIRSESDPFNVQWVNKSTDSYAGVLIICWAEGQCDLQEVNCPPNGVCMTEVDVPHGEYSAWLRAGPGGDSVVVSENSAPRVINVPQVVEPPPFPTTACRADFNGDGRVTSADFASFLSVYGQLCEE